MRRVWSELPVLEIGLLRIHALQDRAAHLVFRADDFFGAGNGLRRHRAGNDDHAVAVAEQKIAARDRDLADSDRLAEAVGYPAADDVRRRMEAAEDGEAEPEDELGVAAAAVDDVAEHSLALQGLGGELAHQRDAVRV